MNKLRIYLDTSVISFLYADVHQQLRIAAVNAHMGYRKKLNLVTPLELMDESTHQ